AGGVALSRSHAQHRRRQTVPRGRRDPGAMNPAELKFRDGLIPSIVRDAATGDVLTLAWMSEESLRKTIETGETWFWSRSRSSLWHKGETSGNTQRVVDLALDCDSDALSVLVVPDGPACHTGAESCFYNEIQHAGPFEAAAGAQSLAEVLESLYALV